jgi:hypothetical protein
MKHSNVSKIQMKALTKCSPYTVLYRIIGELMRTVWQTITCVYWMITWWFSWQFLRRNQPPGWWLKSVIVYRIQTVIHPWVMQVPVIDVPNSTHNNHVKYVDLCIFGSCASIVSSVSNINKPFNVVAWACIAHIHSNNITDKY